MKGESFLQLPETRLASVDEVWEVAPVRQRELFHHVRVGTPEQPQFIAAYQLEETEIERDADREKAASLFPLAIITLKTSSESESAEKKTGETTGRRKTFNSGNKTPQNSQPVDSCSRPSSLFVHHRSWTQGVVLPHITLATLGAAEIKTPSLSTGGSGRSGTLLRPYARIYFTD